MLISIDDKDVSIVEEGNYKNNKISLICVYDGIKKNYVILMNNGTCYIYDDLMKAKKSYYILFKKLLSD